MKNYTYSKLFEINYNMQLHEGNANRRFCSQGAKILFQILPSNIPEEVAGSKLFIQMLKDLEETFKNTEGRIPIRLKGRKNSTVSKYIKLLKDLELEIKP